MELNNKLLENIADLKDKGYTVPVYSREAVREKSIENPTWVHFGCGNIFRAFIANLQDKLLNKGATDRGIIALEGYDYQIVDDIGKPTDNLNLLATLKADGKVEKTLIGSVVESYRLDSEDEETFEKIKGFFQKPSLQMASFTITEKGYSLVDGKGNLLPDVEKDLETGFEKPISYMGKVASLLYHRFISGAYPLAMVSMDNCSHNGDKLKNAMTTFAKSWLEKGIVEREFLDYLDGSKKVSFPLSMIDKITPRPDGSVLEILEEDGFSKVEPIVTKKGTYIAPFVNAEECEYLVVEDDFPNGRPPLEDVGVIFTTRDTVDKVEKMKVCTCLNPLHTTLAIFGCLLGYRKIAEELKDDDLKSLIEKIGYTEGLPVVADPLVISPKTFIDTVVNLRFPNPFMPDSPQRIATDTSQKLAIRFGETIKAYEKRDTGSSRKLKYIPLVFAGWIRYLMGVDDEGKPFDLSPDPLMEVLNPMVEPLKIGENENLEEVLKPIISRDDIFGVDLYKLGLDSKVIEYFRELSGKVGAVRETLERSLKE